MASFAKSKLKAARDAIAKKDFGLAHDAATQVLDYEPENYNAHVFLGLACLELGEHERSEQMYRKAIALKDDQLLAWQGLSKLYERTEQWSSYVQTLQQLMRMFSKGPNADTIKCGETYSKVIIALKEHGSRPEVIGALSLLLPSSPFYSTLSAIPPPDPSNSAASPSYAFPWTDSLELYDSLIELLEKEEESTFKSEFDKRRTRLGASPPEELKKEIGQEIWSSSQASLPLMLRLGY